MRLTRRITLYKRKIARWFSEEPPRRQLNFECDLRIINLIRNLAAHLEVPRYCLLEHCLELALGELSQTVADPALRDSLARHLVSDHLLRPCPLRKEDEHTTKQGTKVKTALSLVALLESRSSAQAQQDILRRLMDEALQENNEG